MILQVAWPSWTLEQDTLKTTVLLKGAVWGSMLVSRTVGLKIAAPGQARSFVGFRVKSKKQVVCVEDYGSSRQTKTPE